MNKRIAIIIIWLFLCGILIGAGVMGFIVAFHVEKTSYTNCIVNLNTSALEDLGYLGKLQPGVGYLKGDWTERYPEGLIGPVPPEDITLAHDRLTLRDWDSVLELECFLALDDAPLVLVADKTGKIIFDGQCEDFAFQLRDRARLWGRNLDTEILTPQETRNLTGVRGWHVINKAVIGNEFWYVEPQNKTFWFANLTLD